MAPIRRRRRKMKNSELCMDLSEKFSNIPMNKIDSACGLYNAYMIKNEPECGACVGAYLSRFLGVDRGYTDDFIVGAFRLAQLLEFPTPTVGRNFIPEFDENRPTHADSETELSKLLHECGAPRSPFGFDWEIHPETVFRNMADKFREKGE